MAKKTDDIAPPKMNILAQYVRDLSFENILAQKGVDGELNQEIQLNFNTNELIGDGIKIDFLKASFGNNDNDPRLRGNYIYSNNNVSIIKKKNNHHFLCV